MSKHPALSTYTVAIADLPALLGAGYEVEPSRQQVNVYRRNLAVFAFPTFEGRVSTVDLVRFKDVRDPIVTWHACPPIPDRGFDWGAHRDSDEGGQSLMGWGRTEAEAILDLREQEAEAEHAEWLAEYERDEAADDRRNARIDDAACDW